MKQILVFCLTMMLMSSCGESERQPVSEAIPDDSAQLRIAVMPTLDCLPLYVADEHGFFNRLGINVSLYPYMAQMDCDTAFVQGRVNGIVTDLVRAENMKLKGLALQYVTATELSWQLLAGLHARITKLKQLDNHMVAMTRFSTTHMLSDRAVDSVQLQPDRVFRIQVNDLRVRMSMLESNIMDALLLPEPWATAARNRNAYVLMDTRKQDIRMGVVAFNQRAATNRQITAFQKAYNMACDTINERGLKAFATLIEQRCGMRRRTVDSLKNITFSPAAAPRDKDRQMALKWLDEQRHIVARNNPFTVDSLLR